MKRVRNTEEGDEYDLKGLSTEEVELLALEALKKRSLGGAEGVQDLNERPKELAELSLAEVYRLALNTVELFAEARKHKQLHERGDLARLLLDGLHTSSAQVVSGIPADTLRHHRAANNNKYDTPLLHEAAASGERPSEAFKDGVRGREVC